MTLSVVSGRTGNRGDVGQEGIERRSVDGEGPRPRWAGRGCDYCHNWKEATPQTLLSRCFEESRSSQTRATGAEIAEALGLNPFPFTRVAPGQARPSQGEESNTIV